VSRVWKVWCSPETFAAIRGDDGFAVLLALARAVNQVRFAIQALAAIPHDDASPNANRQQASAILTAGAALVEGVELARKYTGKHFRKLPAFSALVEIWCKSEYQKLIESNLLPARNKVVAHFDPEEAKRVAADLTFTDLCIFADGQGGESLNLHYKLADGLALMTLIGPVHTEAEMEAQMTETARMLGELAGEFATAADGLIGEALGTYGFRHDADPENENTAPKP